MIRRTAQLLAFLASVAALVSAQALAGETRATHVSGEYALVDPGITTCEPLDEARLRCRTTGFRLAYSGDLEGETTTEFDQVIDCVSGRTRGQGVETLTGSLDGGTPGTLTSRLWFTSDFDCTTFFPSGLRIVAIVTGGSGGFAGTHGVLHFDDSTYRGVLA